MPKKKRVLILCTGNSCRSQMAEGVLRHYGKFRFDVFSAGTHPGRVNATAIQVMREIGIDISQHRSKHVDEFIRQPFDYIITVCDHAKETCPVYFGSGVSIHLSFPDPPHGRQITDEVVGEFRKVRDMIHDKFKLFAERETFDARK